jgi:hypothetical protein
MREGRLLVDDRGARFLLTVSSRLVAVVKYLKD